MYLFGPLVALVCSRFRFSKPRPDFFFGFFWEESRARVSPHGVADAGAIILIPRWTRRSFLTCAVNKPIHIECSAFRASICVASVAPHKCPPLPRLARKRETLTAPLAAGVCKIVSNGFLILRKTFENNYSNGRLSVGSVNPRRSTQAGTQWRDPCWISMVSPSQPVCHTCCLLKRGRQEKKTKDFFFSEREAEGRDLPPLLEVVIRGIYENVKGNGSFISEKDFRMRLAGS